MRDKVERSFQTGKVQRERHGYKMNRLFITILNMSYTASIVILIVLLLRFFLKGAPRVFSYVLWLVVLLRLLCPLSLNTSWGIIPAEKLVEIGEGTNFWVWESDGRRVEGFREIYDVYKFYAPGGITVEGNNDLVWYNGTEYSLQNISRIISEMGSIWERFCKIWVLGVALLMIYCSISYSILAFKLKKCSKSNMYENQAADGKFAVIISEEIRTPFVAGVGLMRSIFIAAPVKPVIYLPAGLDEVQQKLILEHEKLHIKRKDYLIKPIAYLAVCLHWFNPLVWIAFHLMERDMEISCDEAVLRRAGYENKKDYARTLLLFSEQRGSEYAYPIAFGENIVKTRIKKAMKLKEPKKWVIVTAFVGVTAAVVLLLVNGNFDWQRPSGNTTDVIVGEESVGGTDSGFERGT